MNILFDGFDGGDTEHRWTDDGASTLDTSPVRTGTHSRRLSAGGFGPYLAFDPLEDDTIYCGFGFFNDDITGANDITMLIFSEASNLEVGHVGLIRRPSIRGWEIRRGAEWDDPTAGTLLATVTPNIWFPLSWHYIELGANIHDSTGWAELRQDGITRVRFDGDTRNAGTDGLIDLVGFNQRTNAGGYNIDDVYINNEQGAVNNSWLSDTRIYPLLPIGDGFYLQLAGSDGNSIANWQLVDEAGTPVTTDYVFSADVGDKDTYEFSDMPVSVGTIRGLEVRVHAAKSDTGTKQFRVITRRLATDDFGPDMTLAAIPLYQTHHYLLELDPHGGPAAWTIPTVDATEWGVEVRA